VKTLQISIEKYETLKHEKETLKLENETLKHENETLKHENEAMRQEVEVLRGLVLSLTSKISELEARLTKNSKNSNKPPSSDGFKRDTIKNNRIPSGRKSGGQPGHEGITRELTPTPDTVIELKPLFECGCGGSIVVQTDNYTVRQVSDIQPVKVLTVEYRAQEGVCEQCGKVHKASFPEGVVGTTSYGHNIQAIVTYLTTYQLVPLKRATELVEDLFGISISQGTILSSEKEAYVKLEPTEGLIKEEVIESEVAHFDESGMRVNGKNCWLHSAGTKTCTVYSIHEKRGTEAMDAMGILPRFRGTAMHDHWKSYYHYLCAHGECNEHHLRHLKYLFENLGCAWAEAMACLLLRIKRHVELSKLFEVDSLDQEDIETYERLYREILADARISIDEAPVDSQRMIKRMEKYEPETLLFMYDFNVPFTNNLAERDIRMPKAKQKISGGFRSSEGADAFARIRGFISTAKKRGKNVLDGLNAVFKGEADIFLFSEPQTITI